MSVRKPTLRPSHHSHRRKRRRSPFLGVTLALTVAIAGAFYLIQVTAAGKEPTSSQPEESSLESSQVSALPESSEPSSKAVTSEPVSETASSEVSSAASAEDWDFTQPVPESEAVTTDYFKDAVFIGDSRTEGFILYNNLSDTTAYTHKGLMVNTVFTDPVIQQDGQKKTVMEALADTSFSKVYLMFGINESGWAYSDIFIEKYGEIIDEIRRINPDATIYLQSILPVSQQVSNTHSYITNAKIDSYNQLIQQLAADKQVYYLNVAEAVAGPDGALPEEAAADGIHLKKEYCQTWLSYLETHTMPQS